MLCSTVVTNQVSGDLSIVQGTFCPVAPEMAICLALYPGAAETICAAKLAQLCSVWSAAQMAPDAILGLIKGYFRTGRR